MTDAPKIIAYKALNADFTCRGFRFEVGKSYRHDGPVVPCESGFHACAEPFDVWNYYGMTDVRFAEVELSGETRPHGDDSKIAAAEITIRAEIAMPEFIRRAVARLIEKIAGETRGKDKSGDGAQIGSSGDGARIGSSGYGAQIGSSGDGARIGSSGYGAQIGSSGYYAQIGSSGDGARIGSSGDGAQIGSSGDGARIGSSGDGAQIGSSGYYAQIGSSGDGARIGSSGYGARIGSSGNGARIGSSGDGARIEASGERAVVASAGRFAKAMGALGAWIALAEFDDGGNCVGFATGKIDGGALKADVWYEAKGGKLVEAA